MWRFLAACFALILPVVLAGIAGVVWFNAWFTAPGPLTAEKTLILSRGTSVAGIAETLAAEGVVSDPRLFQVATRVHGRGRTLKAGEYQFEAGASPRDVMARLIEGRTLVRRLTVPEGLTVAMVVALVNDSPNLKGQIDELPDEGTLLPETYHYDRDTDRAALIDRMRADMTATVDELWPERDESVPLASPEEAVILASIVEKETGLAAERPHIAGVFINRLRRGMRLQSDPTVIYAVTGGATILDRPLSRADLDLDHPYNTYVIKGLPPGPIANPGRDAIAAVLNPLPTQDLYFVADGTGGHVFAKTLEEHNRNVAKWRRIERERRQAGE